MTRIFITSKESTQAPTLESENIKPVMIDIFSHRLTSYNAFNMQRALAIEDLVRKYNKSIHTTEVVLSPTNEIKFNDINIVKHGAAIYAEDLQGSSMINCLIFKNLEVISISFDIYRLTSAVRSISITHVGKRDECLKSILEYFNSLGFSTDSGKDNKTTVIYGFPGERGPRTVARDFIKLPFKDIRKNYSMETQSKIGVLIAQLADAAVKSGIVIFNGPVGTGKSYLIRSLLSDLSSRQSIVLSPPEYFLNDIGMMQSVIAEYPKSFVILEDLGEMLAIDGSARSASITSNLLNATSGLLSLLSDTIFILTFNHDIGKLNPAFLRPGRCLGKIEIGNLSLDYAQTLTKVKLVRQSYSLAEIYEINRTGKDIENFSDKALGLKR